MSADRIERRNSPTVSQQEFSEFVQRMEHRSNRLEARITMLDGISNGDSIDKSGGRMGRVEDSLKWLFRMGVVTMIGVIGNLVWKVIEAHK